MSKDIFLNQNGASVSHRGAVKVAEPGREATRHRLRFRIMWGLGEFNLTPEEGIPYTEILQEKPPLLDLLRSELVDTLNEDEAVLQVSELDFDLDGIERKLSIDATVKIDPDEEITVQGSVVV